VLLKTFLVHIGFKIDLGSEQLIVKFLYRAFDIFPVVDEFKVRNVVV